MSYDSITIPASGYVSLKKNGLSLSNIRMASIITYSRIDPPKPFCVYGNSTVAYVYGEPGTVITELKVRFWYWLNSNKISHTKYAIINPAKGFSLTLDDASTYLICYAGIDADNIKNICFSAVISRSSSNTKGGILNIKSEIPQSTLSLEENVLKCTTTVWVRIYVIKLWNSNTILRYGINGVPNGSKNTIINLSNLEKNRHYLVILACGHVQDDYCITAIGHAYRDIQYIAFSLGKIFSHSVFDIALKRNGLNVTITMKSIGNVAPSGTLIFIWNSKKLLDLKFGSKQELLLYLKGNTSKRFSFYFVTSVSDEMFGIAAIMKGLCSPVKTSISSTGFVYDFFAYGSDNVCIARYNPSTGQVTVKKLNTDTAKVIDVL